MESVFPVSFQPNPFTIGRPDGDLAIGQPVELRKKDGMRLRGTVESLDVHQPASGRFALAFSSEISAQVEPGDVIYSLSGDEGVDSPQ